MLNAGIRPSFGGGRYQIEVHIPGYTGNLYGRRLRLQLLFRIRAEIAFRNTTELRQRIRQDIKLGMGELSKDTERTAQCKNKEL